MRSSPIALVPEKANEQHYEVPAAFFEKVLGPHLKYSSAYWPDSVKTLADAELAALRESCRHAEIDEGQHILELGLRLGLAHPLDGREISGQPNYRRFQFSDATRIHPNPGQEP